MTDHYAVLKIDQFLQTDGYILEFTTNRPCHLWLRYTQKKPVTHLEPALRRGLLMHYDPRYCFIGWREIEQHQTGDTLIHSFDLEVFIRLRHVWFFTIGYINGVYVPSTSPIIHLPLDYGKADAWQRQQWKPLMGWRTSYNYQHAQTFTPFAGAILTGIELYLGGMTQPRQISLALCKTDPITDEPAAVIQSVTLPFLPDKVDMITKHLFYFPLKATLVSPSKRYAIALWGDPAYPDDWAVWWARWNDTGGYPGEKAFYRIQIGGVWTWVLYGWFVFGYRLWKRIPFYQPGIPTPDMIYPK